MLRVAPGGAAAGESAGDAAGAPHAFAAQAGGGPCDKRAAATVVARRASARPREPCTAASGGRADGRRGAVESAARVRQRIADGLHRRTHAARLSRQTLSPRATPVVVVPRRQGHRRFDLPHSIRRVGAAEHRRARPGAVVLLVGDAGGDDVRDGAHQLEVRAHRPGYPALRVDGIALLSAPAADADPRGEDARKLGVVGGSGSVGIGARRAGIRPGRARAPAVRRTIERGDAGAAAADVVGGWLRHRPRRADRRGHGHCVVRRGARHPGGHPDAGQSPARDGVSGAALQPDAHHGPEAGHDAGAPGGRRTCVRAARRDARCRRTSECPTADAHGRRDGLPAGVLCLRRPSAGPAGHHVRGRRRAPASGLSARPGQARPRS